MSQQLVEQQKSQMKMIECYNCLTQYPVPEKAGCSICPTCGQRSCSE